GNWASLRHAFQREATGEGMATSWDCTVPAAATGKGRPLRERVRWRRGGEHPAPGETAGGPRPAGGVGEGLSGGGRALGEDRPAALEGDGPRRLQQPGERLRRLEEMRG